MVAKINSWKPSLVNSYLVLVLFFCSHCSVFQSSKEDGLEDIGGDVVASADCLALARFIAIELRQSLEPHQLTQKINSLLKQYETVPSATCPSKRRLNRAMTILTVRYPLDEAARNQLSLNEKQTQKIIERSDAFKWRLPGQKTGSSRVTFQKKLILASDRKRRQDLFKLFATSRSRQWLRWGIVDLLKSRSFEAKALGYDNYLGLSLARNGNDIETMLVVAALIKKHLKSSVVQWFGEFNEPWDLDWRSEAAWGKLEDGEWQSVAASDVVQFASDFVGKFGMDFKSISGVSSVKELSYKIESPVLRSDFGTQAGLFAVETHFNEVRQGIPLFQVPNESSASAIFQMFKYLAMQSDKWSVKPVARMPLAILAYRWAQNFEFEYLWNKDPSADPSEIWSDVYSQYWGNSPQSFYASWDDDGILQSPGLSAENMLGAVVASGLLDEYFDRPHSELTFGQALKNIWFPFGSEVPSIELLRRMRSVKLSYESLVVGLASKLQ